MKIVIVSIDFEKRKTLETWFTGKDAARNTENWMQAVGSKMTRFEHHIFEDMEAEPEIELGAGHPGKNKLFKS